MTMSPFVAATTDAAPLLWVQPRRFGCIRRQFRRPRPNSRWRRHPSSSSHALRSRADSPRRRHAVRPALLRPRGQLRRSSATAVTSSGRRRTVATISPSIDQAGSNHTLGPLAAPSLTQAWCVLTRFGQVDSRASRRRRRQRLLVPAAVGAPSEGDF